MVDEDPTEKRNWISHLKEVREGVTRHGERALRVEAIAKEKAPV